MAYESAKIKVKQMYDEVGNAFYPLTHIDAILGDKDKLLDMRNTITKVDLSSYLVSPCSGSLNLYIMNNFIYIYEGNITYTSNETAFPCNKSISITRDIPYKYIDPSNTICNAIHGNNDIVEMHIDKDGSFVAKITPKSIDVDETDYVSSINRLIFNGLYIKNGTAE